MPTHSPSRPPPDAAFVRDHLRPHEPAHFVGGVADWPAVKGWTPRSLADRFGDRRVTMAFDEGEILLRDYVDAIERADDVPYLRNIWLAEAFPELVADVCSPSIAQPNWFESSPLREAVPPHWSHWLEFFLSGSGMRYPDVHIDTFMTHAWLAQVSGVKEVWLWPPIPHQMALVRAGTSDCLAPSRVERDTDLDRLFTHAPPRRLVLEAGDLAFLPAGWWHTTETHTPSITVSGNFVNESNWTPFCIAARGGGLFEDDDATRAALDAFARTAPALPAPNGD